MIDMHSHVDLYSDAIRIAKETNIKNSFTLCVTTSPRAWLATKQVLSPYKNIYVGLGLHPEIVEKKKNEINTFLSNIGNTKFIGEIGIDGTERNRKTLELQQSIFEKILNECNKHSNKIISIHSRSAEDIVTSILCNYKKLGIVIMHWYSGNVSILEKLLVYGCYFSINPSMCMTQNGRKLISLIPMNKVLLETDGPFTSFNGNVRFPWESQDLVQYLASIWNINGYEVEEKIMKNLYTILDVCKESAQNDTTN
jgi:TatD DNase family protein